MAAASVCFFQPCSGPHPADDMEEEKESIHIARTHSAQVLLTMANGASRLLDFPKTISLSDQSLRIGKAQTLCTTANWAAVQTQQKVVLALV